MIPTSLPTGIPAQGPCTDCPALPSSPSLKAGKGVFHRVLHALIRGVDVKANGALPVQAAVAGGAGSTGEPESAGAAALSRLASLPAEGLEGTSDSAGVETALPVAFQAEGPEQSAATALLGAWQALPQPAASIVIPPKSWSDGSHAVAAMLAGGRQELPPFMPAGTADTTLTGQLAQAAGQGDGEAGLPRLILADITAGSVQHPLQQATDPNALVAPERLFEPAKTAISREILSMQLPLRTQGWDGELAQRIVWMAGRQAQWAEITLNPPNLGSLEVHLSLKGNDASAFFYSPHPAVREAIDESLSRLREMLAGAGINLGQTQVSQESFGERRGGGETGFARPNEAGVRLEAVTPAHLGRGLVDLYV